jgi:hypothetical protein
MRMAQHAGLDRRGLLGLFEQRFQSSRGTGDE